jgi:hypothetical protein
MVWICIFVIHIRAADRWIQHGTVLIDRGKERRPGVHEIYVEVES